MTMQPTTGDPREFGVPDAAAASLVPSERELGILHRILSVVDAEGVAQLRDQVRMLQLDPASDPTCRIYALHPGAPRAPFAADERRKLGSFTVRSPQGHPIGELGIWVERGHLRALHYVKRDAGTPALVLPPPEWIELPATTADAASTPPRVPISGGRQALAGLLALDAPTRAEPAAPARTSSGYRPVALVLLTLFASIGAFLAAGTRGADIDAARASAIAAAAPLGAEHGEIAGAFAGTTEGELAGRDFGYRTSFALNRTRVLAAARREALARRRAAEAAAAAAAAAPVYQDNASCSGYRDANGYWVCS